jgi:hypothetical protein
MWYHAITEFGDRTRYWWNRDRDELIAELLVPLLSKHVVVTSRREKKSLFNFGAVSYATILKTSKKLSRPSKGKSPAELSDPKFVKKHTVTEEFVNEVRLIQSAPLTRSLIQQALAEPLEQMFVVMKFDDPYLNSAYEGVIKPAGESFGYRVLRVDEIQDSGLILTQVLEHISRSKLVFVELSGERPNCYYEAGYAQALGKEIIFSIRQEEPLHFDLAGYRFIQWQTEAELRSKLTERLRATATDNEEDN